MSSFESRVNNIDKCVKYQIELKHIYTEGSYLMWPERPRTF